eukprot:m.137071 g.137071  ORF g.137071 m.137071 type:complete len:51 (+) comp22658_c0_seq2:114-266(+)
MQRAWPREATDGVGNEREGTCTPRIRDSATAQCSATVLCLWARGGVKAGW